MPTNNGKFEYPETDWAVGKMAKAGPRGDPGKEFRELEGVRKERSQRLSQVYGREYDQVPEMDPKEAMEAWTKWGKDVNPELLDPTNSKEIMDGLDKYGHVFTWEGTKNPDFLKGLGKDVEVYKVPWGKMYPEEKSRGEIPDSGGAFYIRRAPKISEGEAPGMQMAKAKGDPERSMGVAQDWLGEGYSRRQSTKETTLM